jgi:hypothetical protein
MSAFDPNADIDSASAISVCVTYYDVPTEYHVSGYRYTYVNDHPFLVEPRTRRVVEIID